MSDFIHKISPKKLDSIFLKFWNPRDVQVQFFLSSITAVLWLVKGNHLISAVGSSAALHCRRQTLPWCCSQNPVCCAQSQEDPKYSITHLPPCTTYPGNAPFQEFHFPNYSPAGKNLFKQCFSKHTRRNQQTLRAHLHAHSIGKWLPTLGWSSPTDYCTPGQRCGQGAASQAELVKTGAEEGNFLNKYYWTLEDLHTSTQKDYVQCCTKSSAALACISSHPSHLRYLLPKYPTPAVSASLCSYPTTKHVLHGDYTPVFGNSRYPPSKDKVTYLSGCCVHRGIDSSTAWW